MDTKLSKRIGRSVRQARAARGLTQQEAAERIGISVEFFARIERGGTLPSVPTLVRIADQLVVDADFLLGRAGETTVTIAKPAPSEADRPEVRRIIRRIRNARSDTLRLVSLLLATLERRGLTSKRRTRARRNQ